MTGDHSPSEHQPRIASSTPYAWPWDGRLDPERTALIVLDAPGPQAPAELTAALGEFARQLSIHGGRVLTVETAWPGRFTFALMGSAGPGGRPGHGSASHRFKAAGVDGFFGTALDHILRREGREQLLLAGTWLETSVHSTMRSANDRGYECLLLADLAPALVPELQKGAISSIEMSGGIFGAVTTSEDYRRAAFSCSAPDQNHPALQRVKEETSS